MTKIYSDKWNDNRTIGFWGKCIRKFIETDIWLATWRICPVFIPFENIYFRNYVLHICSYFHVAPNEHENCDQPGNGSFVIFITLILQTTKTCIISTEKLRYIYLNLLSVWRRNCFSSVFGAVCIGFSKGNCDPPEQWWMNNCGNINSLLRAGTRSTHTYSFNNNQIMLPNSEITVLRLRHFPPVFFSSSIFLSFRRQFSIVDSIKMPKVYVCMQKKKRRRWRRRQPLLFALFLFAAAFMCWLQLMLHRALVNVFNFSCCCCA